MIIITYILCSVDTPDGVGFNVGWLVGTPVGLEVGTAVGWDW